MEGGPIASDWFVRTDDPTPVFTYLASTLLRYFGEASVLAVWGVAAVGCYSVLAWIGLGPAVTRRPALFVWGAVLVVAVAPVTPTLLGHAGVPDTLARLDTLLFGVANQYVLGHALQPSDGGVLLLTGVVVWLRGDRAVAGAALMGAATAIHPSYFAAAVVLTVPLAMVEIGARGWRGGAMPALALALVFVGLG